jgi:hypothetical protein
MNATNNISKILTPSRRERVIDFLSRSLGFDLDPEREAVSVVAGNQAPYYDGMTSYIVVGLEWLQEN